MTYRNSVFAGHDGPNLIGPGSSSSGFTSRGGNVSDDGSGNPRPDFGDRLNTDPPFDPLPVPGVGSPANDNASNL